jgi:hypothetical protein
MTSALPAAQLDQIVDLVVQGSVVPIVGDDLLAIETPGGPCPLSQVIAGRLAASLALPPMPDASLSDVAAAYLATGPKAKMQRVRAELGAIVKADAQTWQPAQALRTLATIDAFQLFLTTGLDPLLAHTLRAARGIEPAIAAFTADAKEKDLPAGWRAAPVTVYHLFGAASSPGTNFAVTEEDILEGLLAIKEYSPNLFELTEVLKKSHLLLLGCRYPDWLARIFLRIARGRRLGITRDETELVAGDAPPDMPLVRFLERFSAGTEVLPVTPGQLIAELAAVCGASGPATPAVDTALPPHSIFLSYANDDAAAARALTDALRKCGLDVWLDKGETPDALKPGESFDRRIREQIAKCELFVPVLSRRAAARVEGYFRTEWRLAAQRQAGIAEDVPFLVPVRIDDVAYGESGIPQVMREKHWIEMPGGQADDAVVRHFVHTVRTVRARRAGGTV